MNVELKANSVQTEDTLQTLPSASSTAKNLLGFLSSFIWKAENTDLSKAVPETKVNKKTFLSSDIRMIWQNVLGPKTEGTILIQDNRNYSNEYGKFSFQRYSPISIKESFEYNLGPSINYGFLGNQIPVVKNAYWIGVFKNQAYGLIKISIDDSQEPTYYPILQEEDSLPVVIESYSTEKAMVLTDIQRTNFSIWDFSKEQPQLIFMEKDFNGICFKQGNNQIIGYRNQTGNLEGWQLDGSNTHKIWEFKGLANPDYSLGFKSYLPELNLLLANNYSSIYLLDIKQQKCLWSKSLRQSSYFAVDQPVIYRNNQWFICQASDSQEVSICDLLTGEQLRTLEIGKGQANLGVDQYPLVILNDEIIALNPSNSQQPVSLDLETAKLCFEYEACSQSISNLHVHANYLIGLHQKDDTQETNQTSFYVWESEKGKLIKQFDFSPQMGWIKLAHVSDDLLIFLTIPNEEISDHEDKKELSKNKILYQQQVDQFIKNKTHRLKQSFIDENQLQFIPIPGNRTFYLSFWDLKNLKQIAEIKKTIDDIDPNVPWLDFSFKDNQLLFGWITPENIQKCLIETYDFGSFKA